MVAGAMVSTVQLRLAGVASVLPALSVALTWKVLGPSARPLYACGDVHAAKGPPFKLHSNVEPDSLEENVRFAEELETIPDGPLTMDVSGAVVSPGETVTTS